MFWSKYQHALLAFGAALIFSMAIWFLGNDGYFDEFSNSEEPEITVISHLPEDEFVIKYNTYIYEEKKYLLCGNVEAKLVDHSEYIGQTIAQLLQTKYAVNEGWQADILKDDTVIFFQEINSFCSKHVDMRHLAIKDNYVVIVFGPRGTNGGIAQFTDIVASLLPENVKIQLENGLFEFMSHEDALQALDNFDEYY